MAQFNGHTPPHSPPSFANRGARARREQLSKVDSLGPVVAPGVYDGLSARLALAQGFKCLYMTGAGTSMSRLGLADLGLANQMDMANNAAMIASLNPDVPLIADADTGYGAPPQVARTIEAYSRAGVGGCHIEDQVVSKRCGHLQGKQLVERDVFYSRIRAAAQARARIESEIVIIARTDARAVDGFDEAITRLRGAIDAGADALFFEALASKEEAQRVCDIFKPTGKPVLLNMIPKGVTPNMSVQEARDIGFGLVIFPTVVLEAVHQAGLDALKDLKKKGLQEADGVGIKNLFKTCGLDQLTDVDKKAGGSAYDAV